MARDGSAGRGSRRLLLAPAVALACALVGLAASGPADARGGFRLVKLGEFNEPVFAVQAPGARHLVFVVEQAGRVRVLRNGHERARPFLDIHRRVARFGTEQGLLSIAFDPRYRRNGRFFAYYNSKRRCNRSRACDIEVDSFRRGRHRLRARLRSRRKVIVVRHRQAPNHNGGTALFGPDRRLYLAPGDGGPHGDPENDAQRRNSLLGKVLRISPRAKGGYRVPHSNPFVGRKGRDEIYAMGLRNPFRFSFDSATGALAIGDVGYGSREEVDYVADPQPGMNFGWNDFEGTLETPFGSGTNASPRIDPVFEYDHGGGRCAITGGYVVRDPGLPSLAGQYLFSDYCQAGLRAIHVPAGTPGTAIGLAPPAVAGFGEGLNGQVYVVSRSGPVYRLEEG
jgi:glucose/arabinose dehydrogenase